MNIVLSCVSKGYDLPVIKLISPRDIINPDNRVPRDSTVRHCDHYKFW